METYLLEQFIPVADGIAALLSPYAEVVMHDLESREIMHISNCFSKRDRGFPSNLDGVQFNSGQTVIGPYEKINWDSRRLKSISIVLKDPKGQPAGLLCINLDISVADELTRMISGFISVENLPPQTEQLFKNDWHEKVARYIHGWCKEKGRSIKGLTNPEKKQIVENLYGQGAFKNPKSHEYIAGILNLGRATIFNYLKQIKGQNT